MGGVKLIGSSDRCCGDAGTSGSLKAYSSARSNSPTGLFSLFLTEQSNHTAPYSTTTMRRTSVTQMTT